MNINDFIKTLSIKDKKTLSQKTLKLVEEVGELARIILPYDSAHGTNHRFTDKEAILEEIVDVYLSNISIAHSLGFTDEEFKEMLFKKSQKWSKLQTSEERSEFPLPYEIHVTVDFDDMFSNKWLSRITDNGVIKYPIKDKELQRKMWNDELVEKFKNDCKELLVKPIILDLEINNTNSIKDIMTSSKHFGDNRSAYEESKRIVNRLSKKGYKVLRNKIETVPWHPGAPEEVDKEMDKGTYFESHIGVIINKEQKERLNEIIESISNLDGGKVKLSRNFFKKADNDGNYVNMLTYRNNTCGKNKFESGVYYIQSLLNQHNFNFQKVEIEYALYDTNITHDYKWINS
jgi:NTP pyrophosphatase (non-canonical NTP hydrolase)